MKRVYLQTFGCQMNEYDSELVRSILSDAGYEFTENEAEADIIMLNTCSVRDNAHRKVAGNIHEIRHRRAQLVPAGTNSLVIGILGCMATGLGAKLLEDKGLGIDFVVGPDSYKKLPQILSELGHGVKQGLDIDLSEFETYDDIYPIRRSGANAWVAVMRGCNNFCSFCIVPYTRGAERSRSVDNVLEEVERLAQEGFKQVTLLGQNVNSYKHDGEDFADLVEAVAGVKGIERVRFTSPHPKDFPDALLRVIANNPKVCKQIHLPLQAGNDRVLKLMNRNYSGEEFLQLVMRIRKLCPGMALSTDIIVGFPTETDEDFEDTVRIMKEVEFYTAFMFKYSPRPKTKAFKEMPDDVPEEKKTERIVRINHLQAEIGLKKNQEYVGRQEQVLVEEISQEGDVVYARNDANKIVVLPAEDLKVGDLLMARITKATPHQLKGEILKSS